MLPYDEFKALNVAQRSAYIQSQSELRTSPEGIANQLQFPYRAAKIINNFINPFIDEQIEIDGLNPGGSALEENNFRSQLSVLFADYRPTALQKISQLRPSIEEIQTNPKNLYEMSGAIQLAFANRVSRSISTTMGPLWEKIAKFSPYVVDPERDFGTKIAGVDIILKNRQTGIIEYAQLKTQRNTLTGGQSGRVDAELSLHDNPIFCACFLTKPSWTYNTQKNIPRLAGSEFWNRIGIDYQIVVDELSELFISLESGFVDMPGQG